MATKKTTSSAKKKTSAASKAAKTRVTTVKAVEAGSSRPASAILNRRTTLLRMPVMSAAIAEFLGAFLLAITVLIVRNEPFYLFIGLVGIFMLVGGLSGAHLNPAVTIGAWVSRRINRVRAISYLVAQFLGAMLAFVALNAFLGNAPDVSPEAASFGQTAPELFKTLSLPDGKELIVFMAEAIGAMILGFAYATVLRPRVTDKISGAFTIGGSAFLAMAFASTAAAYVSASAVLNPAMAVSLKSIDFQDAWTLLVYFIGPVLGAVVGFFLHDLLKNAEAEVTER